MLNVQHNPTLLKIYFYFRTVLAFFLLGGYLISESNQFFGTLYPNLFLWTLLAYLGLCLFTSVFAKPHKLVNSFNRLAASLIVDVLAIVLLIHASGGIESGLGYLLLVIVAMAGIFIRGQLGIAFAAMTSLLVIAETLYLFQLREIDSKGLFSAGFLGVLLFCTAYAFQFLTEKLRRSNLEAEAQAAFAAHLQRLAQAIVARMRTGILVVDSNHRIELINDSALRLLDLARESDYHDLGLASIPPLASLVSDWQTKSRSGPPQVLELRAGQPVRIRLSMLEFGTSTRTVIYIEDHRVMTQQAQQLKLASLGRLTASIAHEIRNPLGAISHAAQLLAESPSISKGDKRLTEIIHQHSQRVNQIVESTLALSRRKEPQPETFDLNHWLPRFVNQYRTGQNVAIDLEVGTGQHMVKMDQTHLSQVLTNLLDNGLRYSRLHTGTARVLLRIGKSRHDDISYLEIIDYGPGISDDLLQHVFDPFYTTEERGSGLGLYISKELCEINQASIHYHRTADGMSCFRIDFSHFQRMF
ncbi:MAG: ATP-binding protein [Cellvibrionaceae bacterium]|nr:ATP-binding protein [Cellvibrionaceae bacterium]